MPKYKTIRIAKVNGGSRLQRVQVLANGKYRFVKNTKTRGVSKRLSITTKTRRKRRKSTRKGQVRKTARRAYTGIKKRVKRRKSKTNKDSMWKW
jgi:hypothetical protein|tara:strand:- start:554 stop:835 length:282 start_codon:yes stop_codon:yes gene_type:complete